MSMPKNWSSRGATDVAAARAPYPVRFVWPLSTCFFSTHLPKVPELCSCLTKKSGCRSAIRQDGLGHLLDVERHAVGLGDDMIDDLARQRPAAGQMTNHRLHFRPLQAVERDRRYVRGGAECRNPEAARGRARGFFYPAYSGR
jgi:hypothetical protein